MAAADKCVIGHRYGLTRGITRSALSRRCFNSSRGNRALASWRDLSASAMSPWKVGGVKDQLMVGTLFVDVDSAKNLELVKNNISHKTHNTLYGTSSGCDALTI